ncbi:MAG TPA: hemerythrin domain-containing protein [Polyangiaceae bacterium]|jgi:iron-sulfur cluster repair protein YtfE (RIC family)|nr:hemerythrin domain-containing protein [Polyangiaceae bacterium]
MSKVLLGEIRCQHREQHAALAVAMQRVLSAARDDAGVGLVSAWRELESRLTSHLELEQASLFPWVEPHHAAQIREFRDEHARLRALIAEVGTACNAHGVPRRAIEELAVRLEAHGRDEEALLEGWLDEDAPADTRRHLAGLFVAMLRAELHAH